MSSATYTLPVRPTILDHGLNSGSGRLPAWLGDYGTSQVNEDSDHVEPLIRDFNVTDAMAASGDYFVTLATRLDKMAQGLPQDSAEQIELEHIVQTLFYLQEHWDLVMKRK